MPTLTMCQGLPGSGKSTWANSQMLSSWNLDYINQPIVVVNKDAIRRELELTGWTWSHENEKDVIRIRDSRISNALSVGSDVISDDTNFGRIHKLRLEELARKHGATFVIKVFDTPIEECIRRDALRTGKEHVGEVVIRKMAARLRPATVLEYGIVQPVSQHPSWPAAIICDLDGTLSLFKDKGHRGPYDATLCDQDDVNYAVLDVLRTYELTGRASIIYLSGREERFRPQTQKFFRTHGCPPGPLFMRRTGDFRKDWIIKGELFDAHIRGKYAVRFVLDDRNQVVNFWRKIGLFCFQVAEGNF